MASRRSADSRASATAASHSGPRPSSSVVVVSSSNEVLLLHRVDTGSSFPSAHVFPGGNLDAFHDGEIPAADTPERHQDGLPYRLGAIRECFEESGILLARKDGALVSLSEEERDGAREKIHNREISFPDFLHSVGAVADTDALVPFTRWITPANLPKRFSTQMYLYLLPISRGSVPSQMLVPTPDKGVEHTSAAFASPQSFLARASSQSIILFPPQVFLLTLLARFFPARDYSSGLEEGPLHYTSQRKKLLDFLRRLPAAETDEGRRHPTARIPWADKVMSPHSLFVREADGRVVLGLDRPGAELDGSGRGGHWEQVVLVNFGKHGPRDVEVRRREDVLTEERKSKAGKL